MPAAFRAVTDSNRSRGGTQPSADNFLGKKESVLPDAERKSGDESGKTSNRTDRRRQLLQIAYDLIGARGFEGLRFREVAHQAGINNATLCYYFPSKEALIQGVTDFLMDRLKTREGQTEEPAESALTELRDLFEETRRRVTEDPPFFVVITELALRAKRDPVVDRTGEQRDDFWARRIRGTLERGSLGVRPIGEPRGSLGVRPI